MQTDVTQDRMNSKIDDWEKRLDSLFDDITQMVKKREDAEKITIFRGESLQRLESIMMGNDIQPRMLPTLSILKGLRRVSFVTSAIWVIGCYGRLSVTTNRHQYHLVDVRADDFAQSNWQIIASRALQTHRPFDGAVLDQLIDMEELV